MARLAALLLALALAAITRRAGADAGACPEGMLYVPGGAFELGSTNGFPDEQPVLRHDVASFCLDRTEVTTAAYEACVREERCEPTGARAAWPELAPGETIDWSNFCNAGHPERGDHPINCVTWPRAEAYCRAHGKRLPTEAEFEYAARGGAEERTYPWGEEPPDATRLNACGTECRPRIQSFHGDWSTLYDGDDGYAGTAPVGSYPRGRGRWGHEDLAGNVWEWTLDPYCPYEDQRCWSDERSVRGSGFLQSSPLKIRAHRRNHDVEWHTGGDCGFRCAVSAGGPETEARPIVPPFTLQFQPRGSATWVVALLSCMLLVGSAGWVLGFLGGGGSVIMMPIMIFAVGLTKDSAPAWTLAIVCVTAAISAAFHARGGRVDLRTALAFAPGAVLGALAGARAVTYIPYPVILGGFLLVMFGTARAMLRNPREVVAAGPPPRRAPLARALLLGSASLLIGVVSGVLGIGSGLLIVPVLTLVAGLPMATAVGTSTAVISLSAAAALAPQLGRVPFDPVLIPALAAACAVGTVLGARRTGRVAAPRLRRHFGALVLAGGALILTRQAIPAVRDYARARAHAELSSRGSG